MDPLLQLLSGNARLTDHELAVMLGMDEAEVSKKIQEYEESGIIKGYTAILDEDRVSNNTVSALIEVRVTPKLDYGFEEIARRIAEYEEVEAVYLMSGGFDLAVFVNGRSFKDIALFVAKRLSILDSVVSTATHFMLSRYKQKGFLLGVEEKDERSEQFQ